MSSKSLAAIAWLFCKNNLYPA